jgi:hypothetical protein
LTASSPGRAAAMAWSRGATVQQRQINRLWAFTKTIWQSLKSQTLIRFECFKTRALDSRDMNKHIRATAIRGYKTKATFGIEELNGSNVIL